MSSSTILSDNGVTSGSAGVKSTGGSDGTLLLQTTTSGGTATTAVLIDNAQNVGVGVTPSGSASSSMFFKNNFDFYVKDSGGTFRRFMEYDNSNNLYFGMVDGPVSGGGLYFRSGTGTTTNMLLDASGNLLVGTTSGSYNYFKKSSVGSYVLALENSNYGAGDGVLVLQGGNGTSGPYLLNCFSNAAAVFRIYGNGTYGTVSDENLKKNIETSRGYLSDLMQLRVVKYNWKTQEDTEPKELGFIAQEVEQVFPSLVQTDTREGEMDNKLIKQPVLIPMLVKAIQEQQALITSLTERITALEAK